MRNSYGLPPVPKISLVIIILMLSACSATKLAYNQLDWLIPKYVDGHLTLSSAQSDDLHQDVDELLQWHCAVELRNYSRWLRSVSDDFVGQKITRTRLEVYHHAMEQFWEDILHQAFPGMTRLLMSMTDTQIQKLFRYLDKENKAFKKEFVDPPPKQIRQNHARHLKKRLQRWIGALTMEQEDLLHQWRQDMFVIGADSLHIQLDWQETFHKVLDKRNDPEVFQPQIEKLFFTPEHYWPPAYAEKYKYNYELTMELLTFLAQTLSAKQRQHLAARVASFADDFDDLTCKNRGQTSVSNVLLFVEYV